MHTPPDATAPLHHHCLACGLSVFGPSVWVHGSPYHAGCVAAPTPEPLSSAVAALRELVAIQDLWERAAKISPVEPGYEKDVLMEEWRRRNRIAWAPARRALADIDAGETR